MSNNVYELTNGATSGSFAIYNGVAGSGGSSNTTLTTNSCITYPYTWYYSYPAQQTYDIQLRKVENGWVMLKDGKEYILKSLDEVSKYYKEEKKK